MIRILHVFHEMNNGGIEHFVMEYYRHIDRSQVQFDFLTSVDREGYFDKEILELGGRIFRAFPLKKNPVRNFFDIARIVRENNYDIVHRHTGSAFGYFDLRAAKFGGAKHLILHSHNNQAGNKLLHYLCNTFLQMPCERLACSDEAGKWLFGENASYKVVNNAIDCSSFQFSESSRQQLRQSMGLADKFVVGHVGRFEEQKNHFRLLDITRELVQLRHDAVLICIGTGSLFNECRAYADALNISEHVLFLGSRNDIPELMCAFDLFLLPSLYEGFPFVLVEAQASGLSCVVSTQVPKECNVTNNIHFLPLDASNLFWAKTINTASNSLSSRHTFAEFMYQNGYDLSSNAELLCEFYKTLSLGG